MRKCVTSIQRRRGNRLQTVKGLIVLTKGSAQIRQIALSIDHSDFWINISDHRPVVLSLSRPLNSDAFTTPLSKVASSSPGTMSNPTFTPSLIFSTTCLPTQRQNSRWRQTKQTVVNRFSPLFWRSPLPHYPTAPSSRGRSGAHTRMAGARSWPPQSSNVHAPQNPHQHRNGELGTTSRWDTPEKREAGIIQVTTTWKNQVKAMHWPTLLGQLSIVPKVWTLGTSVGDWRSINFANTQSIRQRCIVDLCLIKRDAPGRKRGRNGRSMCQGPGRELTLPANKAKGDWPSVPFWARGT